MTGFSGKAKKKRKASKKVAGLFIPSLLIDKCFYNPYEFRVAVF